MNIDGFLSKKNVVPRLIFCTGAGLSKESGITTFRDADGEGLWDNINVDDVCNIANFHVNYNLVHDFYNDMRVALQKFEPNEAHFLIAEMQNLYGDDRVLHVTANVDDLAEKAGGTAMHVHGFLTEIVDPYSTNSMDYSVRDIGYTKFTPTPGIISKPNVVMFGESNWFSDGIRKPIYDDLYKVLNNVTSMDTFIIIGSSDTVIPWSIYAGLATAAQVMNINPETHDNDHAFEYNIYQPVTHAITPIKEYINSRMDIVG